ncbi:ROK family protein [Tautonia sociabilis]|uniref:ROK family protein n=1 Tax=Tautonia sociabilis TaxID=2080755 RepID=A0A432MHX3_9BACT|nr:ROK family protein [Tautonia sociabilis]RUL86713.1 ROK family protein [Tautonia sociabilis]
MSESRFIYIGTDSGATTSKVGAVWEDGTTVSTRLLQHPTNAQKGPEAVVRGWVEAVDAFLREQGIGWDRVRGVGLAIPGPFRSYGVLDRSANLPESFAGFNVHEHYRNALSAKAGRPIPVTVGNDGDLGGVGEAQRVRGSGTGSVVMLAPGSGLGCAYVDGRGLPLTGDSLAGMEGGHMPAPLQVLGVPAYPCGCGRTWGCIEVYTTLAGLPRLLEAKLAEYPNHELARSDRPMKERAFALRGLAQRGDELALSIFDFQAKALGLHVANLAMALDPSYFVIGGGLMDPEATTDAFRERYLRIVRESADPFLFPNQRASMRIVPATLGDLSQAIGAALVALYRDRP